MDKKGQMNNVGMIIVVAIALIVGVIFFQVIEQQIGGSTNTISLVNHTLTSTVVNGTAQ